MKRVLCNKIFTVAEVMADSFNEDPLNKAVLEGVEKGRTLLSAHALIHAKHAVKCGNLTLLENDPRAFIIGLESRKESKLRDLLLIIKVYLKTFQMLGLKDIRRILKNNKKVSRILNFEWHKEFIKGRCYRLKIIAIHQDLRGSGAFRKLITPVIEFADSEKIPIVLETHNPENVGLYGHFGFELVKTISSEESRIEQYCMIRKTAN